LFPEGYTISTDNLIINARNTPASECGGDWWFHHTTDEGKELIVIADATGHGASAAMVTAMAFASYNCILEMKTKENKEICPKEVLTLMNSTLYKAGKGQSTMSALVCILDPETGELVMANGGHNLPFVIPNDPTDPRLKNSGKKKRKRRAMIIKAGGSPLGIMPNWDGDLEKIVIEPRDKLLLYTDGIFECRNENGDQWGAAKFREYINTSAESKGSTILANLFYEAFAFFGDTAPDDDITVVVAEVSKNWISGKKVA
jgi:sigma-B regulation protein RsbU (phosphoserine phosphatase)